MTNTSQTFKSKAEAMEYAITILVDGLPLTVEEQQAIEAAGVDLNKVERYVQRAIEPEHTDTE